MPPEIPPPDRDQEWLRRWRALGELARALGQELELKRVAQLIVDGVGPLLEAERVLGLWTVDERRRTLVLVAHRLRRKRSVDALREIPLGAPFVETTAVTTKDLQWVERAAALAATHPGSLAVAQAEDVEALLAMPLPWRGVIVGVLTVAWTAPHVPSPEQRSLAEVLSSILAREVRATQGHAQARRRAEELAAIVDVTEVGLAFLDLDPLLQELLGRVKRRTRADTAIIYLLDERAGALVARKALGVPEAEIAGLRARLGQWLAGEVAARREPVVVRDARADARYRSPYVVAHGIRSMLGVPLLAREQLVGVAELAFHRGRAFPPEDVRLLRIVAERAAMAVENARLYAEAKEARRRLELFLSVVAHDLRGPLTAIRGYAQILQRDAVSAERRQRALAVVNEQVGRMARLIGDLLDFSRVVAGRLAIRPSPMDLAALARRVVEAQQLATTRHEIVLQSPPRVEGEWDEDRLAQVLTNLVDNAVKYSPTGGKVWVRLQPTNDQVQITVSDQGVGMTPEEIRSLFEPFVRIERTRSLRGAGLGLFISKSIVEAHGGTIRAESPGPGRGSTFTVVLPRRRRPSVPPAAGAPETALERLPQPAERRSTVHQR